MVNYDTRTTVFSPEGKIFQVEYAMKAVKSAGLCFALKNNNNIVLFTENKVTSPLLDRSHPDLSISKSSISAISQKVHKIDQHLYVTCAGLTSDANILIDYLRNLALNHQTQYNMPIEIDGAVSRVADYKQYLTQHGGLRPLGASLIYLAISPSEGNDLTLYCSDPSGNFNQYHAVAIGNESMQVMSELDAQLLSASKQSQSDQIEIQQIDTDGTRKTLPIDLDSLSLQEMLRIGMKCVKNTIGAGSNQISSEKLEVYIASKKTCDVSHSQLEFEWQQSTQVATNQLDIKIMSSEEVENLFKEAAADSLNQSLQSQTHTTLST